MIGRYLWGDGGRLRGEPIFDEYMAAYREGCPAEWNGEESSMNTNRLPCFRELTWLKPGVWWVRRETGVPEAPCSDWLQSAKTGGGYTTAGNML